MRPIFAALGGTATFITTLLLAVFICSGQPLLEISEPHKGDIDRYGGHDSIGDVLMGHPGLKKFLANYPQSEELLFAIKSVWLEPSPYYSSCRIQYSDLRRSDPNSLSAGTKAGI